MQNYKKSKWQQKRLQLKVLLDHPNAKMPTKAHPSDHCWDFYAAESIHVRSGETVIIPLGIKLILPKGYALIFKERSGLAKNGGIIGAGVIDEGYRGPCNVIFRWLHPDGQSFHISAGDKIVQGKLEKTLKADVISINRDDFNINTERSDKGFGSTGMN